MAQHTQRVDPKIAKRNEEIIRARRNGEKSLGKLAAEYGISRERVRQIADRGGVDPYLAASSYARHRAEQEYERVEEHAAAILMRFIAGDTPQQIAKTIGAQLATVQEVLDEQVTDEVLAARSRNRNQERFPGIDEGPRREAQPRGDRYWTEKRVFDALLNLALERGRLPSSTQYMKLAPTRDDLPSFVTVRNRLGRWSKVRVDVHRAARRG